MALRIPWLSMNPAEMPAPSMSGARVDENLDTGQSLEHPLLFLDPAFVASTLLTGGAGGLSSLLSRLGGRATVPLARAVVPTGPGVTGMAPELAQLLQQLGGRVGPTSLASPTARIATVPRGAADIPSEEVTPSAEALLRWIRGGGRP